MSSMPKTGTRAWYGVLVAHDVADSCRRLHLPAAARLATASAPAADWNDIGMELGALAMCEMREHERRAVQDAVRHMARGEPIGAAASLARLRGLTIDEWARDVAKEVQAARLGVCA